MLDICYEAFEDLKDDIENNDFAETKYLDTWDFEDEYSHNDIDEAQDKFIEKVREYLHENYPGKYVVAGSWCVFVMTPDRARESHISERTIELFTVE